MSSTGHDNVEVLAATPGPDGRATRLHVLRRINEGQAEVIRRVFRLAADDWGLVRTPRQLNAEGIAGPRRTWLPDPTGQRRPTCSPSSIRVMLRRDTTSAGPRPARTPSPPPWRGANAAFLATLRDDVLTPRVVQRVVGRAPEVATAVADDPRLGARLNDWATRRTETRPAATTTLRRHGLVRATAQRDHRWSTLVVPQG